MQFCSSTAGGLQTCSKLTHYANHINDECTDILICPTIILIPFKCITSKNQDSALRHDRIYLTIMDYTNARDILIIMQHAHQNCVHIKRQQL